MDRQELLAADLATRSLLKRLCRSVALQELGHVIGAPEDHPELVAGISKGLEDTAQSVLLGLHPVSEARRPCCSAGPTAAAFCTPGRA